ncbi:unnamed protein product [Callosobruchus maculatus]|uniref:Uncharacterized protein n=1 Tax=Callosobruchus maculatus TaxID=64391 RepID=A0A653D251_CALMS|nr:unnamed protein product [Callosobruchus maculatus]
MERYNLIKACQRIAEEEKLEVAPKDSSQAAASLAGFGASIGEEIGGPGGIAVGGAIGSIIGAIASFLSLKPVAEILKTLTTAQKEILISDYLEQVIDSTDGEDVDYLVRRIKRLPYLKEQLLKQLYRFLEEMFGYVKPRDQNAVTDASAKSRNPYLHDM